MSAGVGRCEIARVFARRDADAELVVVNSQRVLSGHVGQLAHGADH